MVKGLDKKIAKLERQQDRIDAKIETLKKRHARDLMNQARKILGRAPLGKTSRAKTRSTKTATPTAKKNGGETK